MASGRLLVALCLVALFAVKSEAHGLEDFTGGNTQATPSMASFFGDKPEAAKLPEALDASMPAKPEAASAIPTTTITTDTTTSATSNNSTSPRRSVSVAAGVACGIAAVAVVGVAAAVAYVVRTRRESAVQLGSRRREQPTPA